MDRAFLKIQQILKVDRTKKLDLELAFGAQWFSITDELARYVISHEPIIKKVFSFSICADELFLQTLVYNSKFKDRLYYNKMDENYKACMRYVDWHREDCTSSPHVWRYEDFQELINSDYLFARKFDPNIDKKIIEKLFNYLSEKQSV